MTGSFGRITCGSCGAATTSPIPDEAALNEAHGDWYWPESGHRFWFVGDKLLRRSRASMAIRIDRVAPQGPPLDVGAGEGTLIDAIMGAAADLNAAQAAKVVGRQLVLAALAKPPAQTQR